MGLGSAIEVSLKEARTSAERWRAMVRANIDPIKERERQNGRRLAICIYSGT